jgi:SNF2-related domain/Helicase conserved C-terminal domain
MRQGKFAVGAFVRLKTDPVRAGVIAEGSFLQAGEVFVPVRLQNGSTVRFPESALEDVPAAPESLAERFANGRFVAPDWLRRTLSRLRVTGRLSEMIYSMEATDTDFFAYQFKPVLKLLNSPTDGLLIADEVGLGKTIEAGLIWTELRARFDSKRLLVICPKTLCEKWQDELGNRFGVDASIVNADGLLKLLEGAQQKDRGFAAIASMQSLRPPRGWRNTQEDESVDRSSARFRLAELLDNAEGGQLLVDLFVVDEAHHVRNPETLLNEVVQLLNQVSSHRVLLSATPIHLRNRDLHSLLHLIDPDTFEFEHVLDDLIEANEPIVRTRDALLNPSSTLEEIRALLFATSDNQLLAESKSLKLLKEQFANVQNLSNAIRSELAANLDQVNQLANYITRTRRRDIKEFRVTRDVSAPNLELHPLEREYYEEITKVVTDYASQKGTGEGFLLATPQRLLASSPAAAAAYWESSDPEIDEVTDEDEFDVDYDPRPLTTRIRAVAQAVRKSKQLEEIDTKYRLLKTQLDELWSDRPDAKIIVFSSFKPTLHYLRKRLEADLIKTELLHGSIKESRSFVLKRFKASPSATVLLSSEVGSEGVDLQFCWIVVNYDLPWNPMRIEQRIGRIDRIGQKEQKIIIVNLLHKDTIDDRIYRKLYLRLGFGERALGEFETVLGEPIRELRRRLMDPRLTEQEKLDSIDQTAQAVENLKKVETELEEQAGSLITHGDYVLQAITESRDLNRWLTAEDLLVYVRDRLRQSYAGTIIETSPAGSDTFKISLSEDAKHDLHQFISRNGIQSQTRILREDGAQRYIFTSSVVNKSEGHIEAISQVHPLVKFAADLDARDEAASRSEPVALRLKLEDQNAFSTPGLLVIGIWKFGARSYSSSGSTFSKIGYAGASLIDRVLLSPEQAESLALAAAKFGKPMPNTAARDELQLASDTVVGLVSDELKQRFDQFYSQINAQSEDRALIRKRALDRHREHKQANLEAEIANRLKRARELKLQGSHTKSKNAENMAGLVQAKIAKLTQSCDRRIAEIERSQDIVPEMEEIALLFVELEQ